MLMSFIFFILLSAFLLFFQIKLTENSTKDFLQKLLAPWYIQYFHRLVSTLLSLFIFYLVFKLYAGLPSITVLNIEENLGTWSFTLAAFIWIIAFIFFLEAVYEYGLFEALGLKQLLSIFFKLKPSESIHRDRIRSTTFQPRGLYLRHRHPALFYLIVFLFTDPRALTLNNLLLAIIIIVYYDFASAKQEARLSEDYGQSYLEYQKKVNKYLPGFKKYQPNDRDPA